MAPSRVTSAMWSVAAQGLASASNFGVQFGLVVTMTAARFGILVVGFAMFYLALALGRAWVGDPLVALADSADDVDRRWPGVRARLVALGLLATTAVGAWSAVAADARAELVILAMSIPLLLLQDGHRYRAWALRRFPQVVAVDATWLLTFVVAVGAIATTGSPSAIDGRAVLLAWVGGGVVSWQVARVLDGRRVGRVAAPERDDELASGDRPVHRDRRSARGMAAQQAILAIDGNGLPMALAAVADAAVTAGVRAVLLPFAPLTSVLSGVRVLTLPHLRRSVRDGYAAAAIAKVTAAFAAIAAVISLVTVGGLTLVPDSLLGESGRLVQTWFPLGAVVVAGRMVALPLADLVSLSGEPVDVARIRLATSGIDWSATLVGAVVAGVDGAIVGRASASVVSLAVWAAVVVVRLERVATPSRAAVTSGWRP